MVARPNWRGPIFTIRQSPRTITRPCVALGALVGLWTSDRTVDSLGMGGAWGLDPASACQAPPSLTMPAVIFHLFKGVFFLYFSSLSCSWRGGQEASALALSWVQDVGEISEICSKLENT